MTHFANTQTTHTHTHKPRAALNKDGKGQAAIDYVCSPLNYGLGNWVKQVNRIAIVCVRMWLEILQRSYRLLVYVYSVLRPVMHIVFDVKIQI